MSHHSIANHRAPNGNTFGVDRGGCQVGMLMSFVQTGDNAGFEKEDEVIKVAEGNTEKTSTCGGTGNFSELGNGDRTWQKLLELNDKRQRASLRLQELSRSIKPLEFESYYEFFVINTFKRGISASGHVNIDHLRRNHGKSHRRVRRGSETATREPIASSGSSSSLESDEELIYNEPPIKRHRTDADAQPKAEEQEVEEQLADEPQRHLGPHGEEINGNISVSSIIPKLESNRRRSTRLSSRTGGSRRQASAVAGGDTQVTQIKDLYESIVPKIDEPYRRSDWVLPPRLRFTPEKQMRTRVVHEKVNLNEMVSLGKIQRVLSRFEGGITGVRKKAWNVTT